MDSVLASRHSWLLQARRSYGGIFHIVMGLFTNLGYMSWFGITVATFNLLIGVSFILILAMRGRAAPRPKDVDELAGPKVVAVAVPVEVTGSA